MAQQVVRAHPVGGPTEDQIWVGAARKVMLKEGCPMHYLDIKRHILQLGLVTPGLHTTLESALLKETQKPNGIVKLADQQSGMFTLDESIEQTDAEVKILERPKVKVSMVTPQLKVARSNPVPKVHVKPIPTLVAKINPLVNERYKAKYHKLRKYAKHMIFLNAAVCDEVAQIEDKISKVKSERKSLMKKLLQNKTVLDALSQSGALSPGGFLTASGGATVPQDTDQDASVDKTKGKKKQPTKRKNTKEGDVEEPAASVKPAKAKKGKGSNRNLVQPIPLDGTGRPLFPIELQSLTVHSLGEIVTDKPGFNTSEHIYPSGYCSTRDYASVRGPKLRCTYTCQIVEDTRGPRFEISPDEGPVAIYQGATADESHYKLITAINRARNLNIEAAAGKGPEFFGFSHPTVQNLIQSCPGARRCIGYKWVKYDVAKSESEVPMIGDDEPSVGFNAFCSAAGLVEGQDDSKTPVTSSQLEDEDDTDVEEMDTLTGNQAEHLRSLLISMTHAGNDSSITDDL